MAVEYTVPVPSQKTDEGSTRAPSMVYPEMAERIGNPSPLAMGGVATTITMLSLALMGFRGVTEQSLFVGNLCFVGCVGLLISAQWEMVKGNTFAYTVLSAFGLFYGGYGAIILPGVGIADAYGGLTAQYYNAMGFYILIWAVLNIFFLIASIRFSIVYILVFACVELCFVCDASSYFALADGKTAAFNALATSSGVFGFIAGLLAYYCVAHYLCADVLPFPVPLGDTSHLFLARKKSHSKV